MALVAVEGFDLYNGTAANSLTAPSVQTKWIVTTAASTSLVAGRFGGQAFRSTSSLNTRPLVNNYTSGFAVGMAIRVNTLPTATALSGNIGFETSAGGFQFGLRVNTVGGIDVLRMSSASAGTLLGSSSAGVVGSGNWYYLEIEADLSTTVGRVTVYLDGAQIINLTNVNNMNSGSGTNVGILLFNANSGSTGMGSMDIDDVYEADTSTRIGNGKVETLRASADTATKNWTPDTGIVNFSRINETTADGDTTYVQASTVGTLDLYSFGSLSSTPSSIYGVQVTSFARKTDATARDIANSVKSGATSSDGGNFALGSSYSKFDRMLTTDPNTSAAWTAANVNALQAGPKVTI